MTSFIINVSKCVLLKSMILHSLPEITLVHDSDNILVLRNLIRTCRSDEYLRLLSQRKKKKEETSHMKEGNKASKAAISSKEKSDVKTRREKEK